MRHIAIFGPTAVGKTSLSIDLAKELDSEVISADSVQIYRDFNIISAKVTPQEQSNIKHHLIDFLGLEEQFDAKSFLDLSTDIIKELESKSKRAIVVGGTGLYIKALTNGLIDFDKYIGLDYQYREDKVYEELLRIDRAHAEKIGPNNIRKLKLSLNNYIKTGIKPSDFHKHTKSRFSFLKFALTMDRSKLYNRINTRVDQMLEQGMLEEAEKVYNLITKSLPIIGYKEFVDYFNGKSTFNEAIDNIKQNSRNYAKRQLTWMRSNDYDVINVDIKDPLKYIIGKLKTSL